MVVSSRSPQSDCQLFVTTWDHTGTHAVTMPSDATFQQLERTCCAAPNQGLALVLKKGSGPGEGPKLCCKTHSPQPWRPQMVPVLRLRGGGGDGGATGAESRDSYLSMYATKKPDKVDPWEEKLAACVQCRLTHVPLSQIKGGVLMDPLGHLYNKEAVLGALLEKKLSKKKMPPGLEHVSSLKEDMLPLQLTLSVDVIKQEPSEHRTASAGDFQRGNDAPFCCPLTARAMNGKFRFVALRPSGFVCSEQALKEGRAAVEELVGSPLKEQEVVVLNGTEEEVDALWEKHVAKRAAKKEKKLAKEDKRKAESGVGGEAGEVGGAAETVLKKKKLYTGDYDMATEIAKNNAKKYKASDHVPAGATPSVYASLFTSSSVGTRQETYGARNLSFQRG